MEPRSIVDLPDRVQGSFEVFVNGVPQRPGTDFDQVGRSLVFMRDLRGEGRLGFWRWLSLFCGVAGTYRRADKVDLVHTVDARRVVTSLEPLPSEPWRPSM
ncbi:MAG: hypothetical protein ACRDM1_13650 [Gaiellaceae bacterium]